MFSQTKIRQWAKLACCSVLICLLSIGLISCGGKESAQTEEAEEVPPPKAALSEVAPPAIFEELRQTLDNYQPQVSILSPTNGEVIEDTRVSIQVDVKDYPLFKNQRLGMGPHLHVILDNQPYRAVYTAEDPIIFEDLTPGTHTIRMFASRPWHESFKNEGAYAQVTFHLFTETGDNAPDLEEPLLTYSRPKGSYGAEPILLDYYLTNAPIRLGEEDSTAINPAAQRDWRVRATINGESFIMDNWLPIYLEGFQVGQNWIKLELLDQDGNRIDNAFNTAARLFTYQPQGEDTLSKLVREELTAEEARVIVDAEYQVPEPEVEEEEVTTEEATPEAEEEASSEPEAVTEEQAPETTAEETTSEAEEEAPVEAEEEMLAEPEAVTEEQAPETAAEEKITGEETPTESQAEAEEEAPSEPPEAVTKEQAPEIPVEETTPELQAEEEMTREETPTESQAEAEEEAPSEPEAVTEEQAPEMPAEETTSKAVTDEETASEEKQTESETSSIEEPETVTEFQEEMKDDNPVTEETPEEMDSTAETEEAETPSDETVVEQKTTIGQ